MSRWIDPGQSLGVPEPTDPITGEPKSNKKPPRRINRAARDRQAMRDLVKEEQDFQNAVTLGRLHDHLSEEHGPLGKYGGFGLDWYDLAALEKAHDKLHETWKGHTH